MSSQMAEAALGTVLEEAGNVDAFVDSFFAFLAKRTDFFVECPPEGGKLGFPPGVAESIIRNKFKKWQLQAKDNLKAIKTETESLKTVKTTIPKPEPRPQKKIEKESYNAYNGRVTDKYSWSQSIGEVDVLVPVSEGIKKGAQVKVAILSDRLSVTVEGSLIVEGKFPFPVKKEDCIWNLLPGQGVSISLQKSQERWWQALLDGEELLEMSKIDAVRPAEELDEEEQMKLQELCWNEERKRQGLPTSEQLKMEKLMEKAWNAEGSPFKGKPVDTSIFKFGADTNPNIPL